MTWKFAIKIRKLEYISLRDWEWNWASVKLKSRQLLIQTIERRTVKFKYRKVFVPYSIAIKITHNKSWLCDYDRKMAPQLGSNILHLYFKSMHAWGWCCKTTNQCDYSPSHDK